MLRSTRKRLHKAVRSFYSKASIRSFLVSDFHASGPNAGGCGQANISAIIEILCKQISQLRPWQPCFSATSVRAMALKPVLRISRACRQPIISGFHLRPCDLRITGYGPHESIFSYLQDPPIPIRDSIMLANMLLKHAVIIIRSAQSAYSTHFALHQLARISLHAHATIHGSEFMFKQFCPLAATCNLWLQRFNTRRTTPLTGFYAASRLTMQHAISAHKPCQYLVNDLRTLLGVIRCALTIVPSADLHALNGSCRLLCWVFFCLEYAMLRIRLGNYIERAPSCSHRIERKACV